MIMSISKIPNEKLDYTVYVFKYLIMHMELPIFKAVLSGFRILKIYLYFLRIYNRNKILGSIEIFYG